MAVIGTDIIEFLLDHAANIDAVNSRGQTPLIVAAVCRNIDAAMILWHRGADLYIKDRRDRSAYDLCINGNPVMQVFEAEDRRRRREAFAMTSTQRLAKGFPVSDLDIELVDMVLMYLIT